MWLNQVDVRSQFVVGQLVDCVLVDRAAEILYNDVSLTGSRQGKLHVHSPPGVMEELTTGTSDAFEFVGFDIIGTGEATTLRVDAPHN